jgi:hypothetical protein
MHEGAKEVRRTGLVVGPDTTLTVKANVAAGFDPASMNDPIRGGRIVLQTEQGAMLLRRRRTLAEDPQTNALLRSSGGLGAWL